ncbi:uncharacterized protein FOMMEDRAFT_162430 [Fomitiporia mediterranea MF3/22]|uniref:uncharacterized protein n=1 Tax=Fomitiporia mediterranea (strain MF3/22) TaxID=694068 RepID=UPI0004409121|nr:uncharacterized protein FOMMEDRAFT_162430 [Fomitiporia mediterranea MF3/22]EJC98077.1 hypothetical protein FOMMEDRAFT_162430 [Fomitiporia mediterranea MF3/22]
MSTAASGSPATGQPGVMMPSELYHPDPNATQQEPVATPAQQGAPEPGSGTTVHEGDKVPFKDQMVGYAKSIRGSVLKKPETKETGERILKGEMSAKEYFEQKHDEKA